MSYKIEKNGWVYIHIEGTPKERGRQHGKHVGKQLEECIKTTKFNCLYDYGKSWDFFIEAGIKLFKPVIKNNYIETYE